MAKKVYIDLKPVLADKNSIIKFVTSDRSDGKTTAIIYTVYDNFKQDGRIGVISRRYVEECNELWVNTLITNLQKVRQTGTITYKGSPKKHGIHIYEDGKEFAVVVPLSRAGSVKSGFDIATHNGLFIDEYTPLNGRYLPEEPTKILELWRTIDRDTFTTYTLVMTNHVTLSNPLFSYFNVIPKDGLTRYQDGRFLLLQIANKGNRNAVANSPLGELVKGTSYYDYAIGGALYSNDVHIMPKHTRNMLNFGISCNGRVYALYTAAGGNIVIDYPDEERPPQLIYTVTANGGKDGGIYLPYARNTFKTLQELFYLSRVYCANEKIYFECVEFWKLMGGKV